MSTKEFEEILHAVHMKLKSQGPGAKAQINKDVTVEYLGGNNFAVSIRGKSRVLDPPDSVNLNDPTEDGWISKAAGPVYARNNGANYLLIGPAVASDGRVFRSYVEWDVSSIPDGSTVTSAIFKFECYYDRAGRVSGIFAMANRPSTSPDATVYDDCGDGTQYVAYNGFVPPAGQNKSQDLGAAARADLETALAVDWFAIGMRMSDESADPVSHKYEMLCSEDLAGVTPPPTLYVEYTAPAEPTVTTQAATGPCVGTGTLHGTITDIGAGVCDERGFEWGLVSGGPYPNSWTEAGAFGVGAFSHTFTDFPPGTTIYYRAKAHNVSGWGYGAEMFFTTCFTPGIREPKIELRLSDIDPPAVDPPKTIYRDIYQLPDPVLLGITIRYFNFDDVNLYFKITGSGTGYTFGTENLGLLASGADAYRNLDEFASRAKPATAKTESIVLTLRAYTDAGYTDLKWTYQRTVTVIFIDSNDGSWTLDELDNFDGGTVEGWAISSGSIAVATDYVLSPPYSCKGQNSGSGYGLKNFYIYKSFTTPNKSTVYGVFDIRLDSTNHYIQQMLLRENTNVLVFLGRYTVAAAVTYLPDGKWMRIVVPLPPNTTFEIQIWLYWYNPSSGITYAWIWLDDVKIISK